MAVLSFQGACYHIDQSSSFVMHRAEPNRDCVCISSYAKRIMGLAKCAKHDIVVVNKDIRLYISHRVRPPPASSWHPFSGSRTYLYLYKVIPRPDYLRSKRA